MEQTPHIGRYASMLYRMGNRYYERAFQGDSVGCGQQFFLLSLHKRQGQGVKDLAELGSFDKGTAARAVQKLEEQGLLRREEDQRDKRAQRLYTTEKAAPVIAHAQRVADHWSEVLTRGMSQEEITEALRLMGRMAENAFTYLEKEEHTHDKIE